MTNYANGAALERAVKKLFEANGYYVMKSGGSKGSADLVALKRGETVLVQCKVDGYLRPAERKALCDLALWLGARPVIGQWRKQATSARYADLKQLTLDGGAEWWSPDWALEET